jgi:hypothetical protein
MDRLQQLRELRLSVRRCRRTDLLRALGKVARQIRDREENSMEPWRSLSPWSLAALARESILWCTEHRPAREVTHTDVLLLNDYFVRSHDRDPSDPIDAALGIMTRTAYGQFPITRTGMKLRAAEPCLTEHCALPTPASSPR